MHREALLQAERPVDVPLGEPAASVLDAVRADLGGHLAVAVGFLPVAVPDVR